MDDRFWAVWGSYGAAAGAMILTGVVAFLVLRRAQAELEELEKR